MLEEMCAERAEKPPQRTTPFEPSSWPPPSLLPLWLSAFEGPLLRRTAPTAEGASSSRPILAVFLLSSHRYLASSPAAKGSCASPT